MECYLEMCEGVYDIEENLRNVIKTGEEEILLSILFVLVCIDEYILFINGSL